MSYRTVPVTRSPRGHIVKPALGAFLRVEEIGVTFPDVEAVTRYDGSPVLKAGGVFMGATKNSGYIAVWTPF